MATTTIVNCDWCQAAGQIEIYDRVWDCDVCGGKGLLEEDIVIRTDEDMDEEEAHETRTVHDPFVGKDVQISDRLVDRLRGKYASGPHLPNGKPEFGWKQFEAPPIQHEAADRIEALEAFLALYLKTYADTDRNPTTVEESIVIAEARRLRNALPDQG